MGTLLGPKYVPYTYMDPLGICCISKLTLDYLSYIWLQGRWVLVEDACIYNHAHLYYSLNSMKGVYVGDCIGEYDRGY